jgi:hypothetical protein
MTGDGSGQAPPTVTGFAAKHATEAPLKRNVASSRDAGAKGYLIGSAQAGFTGLPKPELPHAATKGDSGQLFGHLSRKARPGAPRQFRGQR